MKCAEATLVALSASETAQRALWACENAIDEAAAAMRKLEAARAQLTVAAKSLRDYTADLNRMSAAYIERMPTLKAVK